MADNFHGYAGPVFKPDVNDLDLQSKLNGLIKTTSLFTFSGGSLVIGTPPAIKVVYNTTNITINANRIVLPPGKTFLIEATCLINFAASASDCSMVIQYNGNMIGTTAYYMPVSQAANMSPVPIAAAVASTYTDPVYIHFGAIQLTGTASLVDNHGYIKITEL